MQTLCFKVALNPTEKQASMLSSHVGAVRFAFNWSLQHVTENWDAVAAGTGVTYINSTHYGLLKTLNASKSEVAPWWKENSKEAFSTGTRNFATALQNWRASKRGERAGEKMNFPKFRTRHHDSQTGITFTTGIRRLEPTGRHFTLPRIGTVRLYENLVAVQALLAKGGSIGNVIASNSQGRWWIAINVRISDELALHYFSQRHKRKANRQAGLDVGLKAFLADSEGNTVENPQFLRKSLAKLRKANKRLARRRAINRKTGEVASSRWEKARVQLVKQHAHVANQRKDFLHKLSTRLVLENKLIGVENLNVHGMVKNKHLSLSISDAGWGEFKRQLKYKAAWYGSQVIEVDKFFPSTKKCSGCGSVKTKLTLSERTYSCAACGLVTDRDENAARTILQEAVRIVEQAKVAQSCGETQNERGGASSGSGVNLSETSTSEALSSIAQTAVLQSTK